MRISYSGELGNGVAAKDLILATIGRLGTGGMVGHAVEYAGETIRGLSMENRMTICNMTIEGGGRAGMIAPDDTTFAWVEGRPAAPADFDAAVEAWRELPSDDGAGFDTEVEIDAASISPMVTWGTTPGQVVEVDGGGARALQRARGAGAALHGPRARQRDPRRSSSTGCSSAPAPTHGSRTCARRPRWSPGARSPARSRRWSCRARRRSRRRPRPRASTRSSAPPASTGAAPAARCAWG